MLANLALQVALLATSAEAFWRLPCVNQVVYERSDPIVNPGQLSGHMHAIMGANNFNYSTTFADLRASDCTTCQVSQDKSVYWVPNLYFRDKKTGLFTSIEQRGGMLAYYIQRYGYNGEKLYAFPDGFKMLAGRPSMRSYDGTPEAQAISYRCLDYPNNSPLETKGFPNQNCPNGLRQQIFFPSCWDGVNTDSPDHKSHMAYPSQVDSGTCPSSHPYRTVSLFYEIIWWTGPYWNQIAAGTGEFVLSNGDATGYSSHADFVNGWDFNVLQQAIDTCTADSGVFTDCKLFDVIDYQTAAKCQKQPGTTEQVTGTMSKLPGNNPVTYGPGPASMQPYNAALPAGTRLKATLGIADGRKAVQFPTKPVVNAQGCFADGYPLSRTMGGLGVYGVYSQPTMTNSLCSAYCLAQGFKYSGTEYSSQCFCANALPPTKLDASKCNMACSGDANSRCGGDNALTVSYNPGGAALGSNTPPTTGGSTGSSGSTTPAFTTSGTCAGARFETGAYICWGNTQLCPIVNGVNFGACAGGCFDPKIYHCSGGFLQPGAAPATPVGDRPAPVVTGVAVSRPKAVVTAVAKPRKSKRALTGGFMDWFRRTESANETVDVKARDLMNEASEMVYDFEWLA
ncbi:hypothetical protein BCR37DRAFT_390463 [Protomyces lactucae-debilis]|uniref:WSC domain-containing protein n=1 Tax=Protomyces lactucae-debilis TaxID=2754530 RepID=A0A1Y2FVD4_PROLT|nr:uncharacterized protein BCR37DRAFT_390463 [Protomyces lactucae-debilis]ORY87960.1 hypothetical protein BCR37DRAFT_390463 [Protomyces lactucae-debilis]